MGATLLLNGPAIPEGVQNAVLRDALFHSPIDRGASKTSYHVIDVGVREGSFTTWVGSFDQAEQRADAGTPKSLLDSKRVGMRLRSGQSIVVRVTTTGTPASLEGCRVNFRLALVGGREGAAKPLVASGLTVTDMNARTALAALERQVNESLAQWEESVQLQDPVVLAGTGAFHGRMQRDSATSLSLQRYNGNWVEVDGEAVSLGSSGLSCTTTDGLLSASGGVTATAPSSSTLYYVYVGSPVGGSHQLRLSETAPSRYLGTYYLGADEGARRWRFVGWVYLNGSTQFSDSVTAREVANAYNKRPSNLLTVPAYNDNNAQTSYTANAVTWTLVNGGTGASVSFIANGEDAVQLFVTYRGVSDTPGTAHGPALGIDGATNVPVAGECVQVDTERVHISLPYVLAPGSVARRTASLLNRQSAGITTIFADVARNGAATDPAETYLSGWVMT